MHGRISRRDFAEIAVASFGMIALPCRAFSKSDVSAAGTGDPLQPHNVSVPAGAKILVAYASRCGSTAEIAEALGHDLQSRGYRTEIVPVGKVSDVSAYQAVLLGSAVRAGIGCRKQPDSSGSIGAKSKTCQAGSSRYI